MSEVRLNNEFPRYNWLERKISQMERANCVTVDSKKTEDYSFSKEDNKNNFDVIQTCYDILEETENKANTITLIPESDKPTIIVEPDNDMYIVPFINEPTSKSIENGEKALSVQNDADDTHVGKQENIKKQEEIQSKNTMSATLTDVKPEISTNADKARLDSNSASERAQNVQTEESREKKKLQISNQVFGSSFNVPVSTVTETADHSSKLEDENTDGPLDLSARMEYDCMVTQENDSSPGSNMCADSSENCSDILRFRHPPVMKVQPNCHANDKKIFHQPVSEMSDVITDTAACSRQVEKKQTSTSCVVSISQTPVPSMAEPSCNTKTSVSDCEALRNVPKDTACETTQSTPPETSTDISIQRKEVKDLVDLTESDESSSENVSVSPRELGINKKINGKMGKSLKERLQAGLSMDEWTDCLKNLEMELTVLNQLADTKEQEYLRIIKQKRKREEIIEVVKRHKPRTFTTLPPPLLNLSNTVGRLPIVGDKPQILEPNDSPQGRSIQSDKHILSQSTTGYLANKIKNVSHNISSTRNTPTPIRREQLINHTVNNNNNNNNNNFFTGKNAISHKNGATTETVLPSSFNVSSSVSWTGTETTNIPFPNRYHITQPNYTAHLDSSGPVRDSVLASSYKQQIYTSVGMIPVENNYRRPHSIIPRMPVPILPKLAYAPTALTTTVYSAERSKSPMYSSHKMSSGICPSRPITSTQHPHPDYNKYRHVIKSLPSSNQAHMRNTLSAPSQQYPYGSYSNSPRMMPYSIASKRAPSPNTKPNYYSMHAQGHTPQVTPKTNPSAFHYVNDYGQHSVSQQLSPGYPQMNYNRPSYPHVPQSSHIDRSRQPWPADTLNYPSAFTHQPQFHNPGSRVYDRKDLTTQKYSLDTTNPENSHNGFVVRPAPESSVCSVCQLPAGLLCSGCRKVRYCSKPCQVIGWKHHSQICAGAVK